MYPKAVLSKGVLAKCHLADFAPILNSLGDFNFNSKYPVARDLTEPEKSCIELPGRFLTMYQH